MIPLMMMRSMAHTKLHTKTSPQTSVMKVITGKNQPKRTPPKGNKGPQVRSSNQYGPSKNTRSQTKIMPHKQL